MASRPIPWNRNQGFAAGAGGGKIGRGRTKEGRDQRVYRINTEPSSVARLRVARRFLRPYFIIYTPRRRRAQNVQFDLNTQRSMTIHRQSRPIGSLVTCPYRSILLWYKIIKITKQLLKIQLKNHIRSSATCMKNESNNSSKWTKNTWCTCSTGPGIKIHWMCIGTLVKQMIHFRISLRPTSSE